MSTPALPAVSWIAVGLLGLITGSFLNAVIHRLPLGISLLNPRRSFCPSCNRTIPWHENLPVVSWILLRGRCSGCAMPIALRYPLVELLTGGLYLLIWGRFGLPLAPVFWIFLSLLVAATFIDFDHLIIPDEITLGGTGAGVVCAALLPGLMGEEVWWRGLLWSVIGAASGFAVLFLVVELGKIVFGKQKHHFPESALLEIIRREGGLELVLEKEAMPLEEFFWRPTGYFWRPEQKIEAETALLEINGERHGPGRLTVSHSVLSHGGREWSLGDLANLMPIRASVTEIILPREAMGFGDVKFLACIGAFLGWKGVFFTLFGGSVIGAVIGVATMALTRGRSGGRIPFGPYLALGALLWVLAGPELLAFYLSHLRGEGGFLLQHG